MSADLVLSIAQKLTQKQLRLTVAESCTGGWLAKVCTDLPGSSAWFECGFVAYSNAAKQQQLGVPAPMLAEHGAVSAIVVDAMLRGALRHSGADVAIAISGVAGPTGGSADKPVGTVFIGWLLALEAESNIDRFQFGGDRNQVRQSAVEAALAGMDRLLN